MIRSGVWLYVWSDRPAAGALDGFTGALVRAANGDGTVSGSSGYDFAASWRAWTAAYPGRCQPWTYLYPSSDGARSARALYGVVGRQPLYQVDLEDAVPPATIRAFCASLRALAPGAKLIFDSYPSRAQFLRVNGAASAATWDTAIEQFDGLNPQIYWATQAHYDADRDGVPDYLDDARGMPVLPAISVSGADPTRPPSWPDVLSSGAAQRLLDRFGTLALWRYPDSAAWRGKLTTASIQEDDMANVTDDQLAKLLAGAAAAEHANKVLSDNNVAGRVKDIAAAVAAQGVTLATLGEQLSRAAAGDVDEAALAAALAPAVGDALAAQLAARLAS